MTNEGATGGQAVRIVTLNTGGLNAAVKRTKIMAHIKSSSSFPSRDSLTKF